MFELFLKSMAIGALIAAPVGPVGGLCVRRTLLYGTLCGLVSGLGAATADVVFCLIAGLGLNVILSFIAQERFWLSIAGGLFLVYLGFKVFLTPPAKGQLTDQRLGYPKAFTSAFLLTITNPIVVLSFIALFAAMGVAGVDIDLKTGVVFNSGVFLGSSLWWIVLTAIFGRLRSRLGSHGLVWVNRAAGVIILVSSIFVFLRAAP